MEDESSKRYKKIIVGLVLVMAYFSMHAMGLTFGDLWGMVQGELDQKRAETHEYRETVYSEQVSREMREQAARMSGDQSGGNEGGVNNEIAAERKRMMDQSAANSEQNRQQMLKGDAETLKKQARRNIRESGGDN